MTRSSTQTRRSTARDRRFLDTLVFLRALYARRGPMDRDPVLPIGQLLAAIAPSRALVPAAAT